MRLRGEACFVQNGIKKIPRAVAGEGPACPVGTVRTGSEAQREDASFRIAKRRHRTSPILPIDVSAAADLGDLSRMLAKPRTEIAANNARIQRMEGARGSRYHSSRLYRERQLSLRAVQLL